MLRPSRTVAIAPHQNHFRKTSPDGAPGARAPLWEQQLSIRSAGQFTHTPTGVWAGLALRCLAGGVRFPVGWWAPPPLGGATPHGCRAPTADPYSNAVLALGGGVAPLVPRPGGLIYFLKTPFPRLVPTGGPADAGWPWWRGPSGFRRHTFYFICVPAVCGAALQGFSVRARASPGSAPVS